MAGGKKKTRKTKGVQLTIEGAKLNQPTALDLKGTDSLKKGKTEKKEVESPNEAPSMDKRLEDMGFQQEIVNSGKSTRAIPVFQQVFIKNQTLIM